MLLAMFEETQVRKGYSRYGQFRTVYGKYSDKKAIDLYKLKQTRNCSHLMTRKRGISSSSSTTNAYL